MHFNEAKFVNFIQSNNIEAKKLDWHIQQL